MASATQLTDTLMASKDDNALKGHNILITGASRGIGQAVSRACAAAGATVFLAARDVRALSKTAELITASGAAEPVIVPINLESATVDDYTMVAALIEEQFGQLDGLILGAAMLGPLTPLSHYDPLMWARVFQVNLHSNWLLIRACFSVLKKSGRGSVIMTLAEETGQPNWGAYAVSKAALRALFETWAAECRSQAGIRMNAVIPPPTATRLRMEAFPAALESQFATPDAALPLYLGLLTDTRQERNGEIVSWRDAATDS